jgi:hypothetical protein
VVETLDKGRKMAEYGRACRHRLRLGIRAPMHLTNREPIRNDALAASAHHGAPAAPADEIEVTEEMASAGVAALEACRGACADEHIVREVYTAMLAVRHSRTLL